MKKVVVYTAVVLFVAQFLLILVSWLATASFPEYTPSSLLSSEGIRWFFGRFVDNLCSPFLVWLLLVSMAVGAVRASGILHFSKEEYRQRIAMRLVLIELGVFIVIILSLTLVPHAILLNSMGEMFPSPFSRSIVPYVCFAVIAMSLSFGLMSERLKGVDSVFDALSDGIRIASPLFLIYVLVVQLYSSIAYMM